MGHLDYQWSMAQIEPVPVTAQADTRALLEVPGQDDKSYSVSITRQNMAILST